MALLFPHPSFPHSHHHKPISQITTNHFPITPLPLPNPRPAFPSLLSKLPTIPKSNLLRKTLIFPNASPPSSSSFAVSETTDFSADDLGEGGGEEDLAGSPWEGAVVYRRDASVSHVEFCTTLERLGLGKLSTAVSRTRASAMGIRLPARRAKVSAFGEDETPVLISVDVTRRKRRLKLDGIVRTVITLGCNRCAEPAAEGIFSNFTLLLTEDPVEESDEINMGTIFGQERSKPSAVSSTEEELDDEKQIDSDDWLYFPSEEKEIDLSKHIRDIVHVEITINATCDANCKGLCLKCGTNLNKSTCNCSKHGVKDREYGPLKNLRKQMQQR